MRQAIPILLGALSLQLACAASIKKQIKVAEVNTDHALLTGHMEEWSGEELELPPALSEDVLLDAATCLLYTSPSPRDGLLSRMPSSA